jgi:hypothetical protein
VGCWQRRLPSPGASVCVTHLAMESRVDSLRPFSPGLRASAPEADAPNRRFWFVGLMGAAVGAFYFAPVDTWIHDLWQVVLGWAAATTVVVAIRGRRPTPAAAWYLLADGMFLNATGILVATVLAVCSGSAPPLRWRTCSGWGLTRA